MNTKQILFGLSILIFASCSPTGETKNSSYPEVLVAGAMSNVMWKGELGAVINLDTISDKKGLYGLGPESYLTGELLINDGKVYRSKVLSDSTMEVVEANQASASFFVYTNVNKWREIDLPDSIQSIKALEVFIDNQTKDQQRPFAFKLIGKVSKASIHIQNLPKGSVVSSPKEAHQGQVNYDLQQEQAEIIGFFSTKHQGVFTHHDSFIHLHLINQVKDKMGHLDSVEFGEMRLFLPKR